MRDLTLISQTGYKKLHEELTGMRVEEASDRQRKVGLAERLTTLSSSRANVTHRAERLAAEAKQYL